MTRVSRQQAQRILRQGPAQARAEAAKQGIDLNDLTGSDGEIEFITAIRQDGALPLPVREFPFGLVVNRKWRFDFAWIESRIAVEIEGGTWSGRSRHSRGEGFEADCEKYNAAALLGWKVLRFTTEMVSDGRALDTIRKALAPAVSVSLVPPLAEQLEDPWTKAERG